MPSPYTRRSPSLSSPCPPFHHPYLGVSPILYSPHTTLANSIKGLLRNIYRVEHVEDFDHSNTNNTSNNNNAPPSLPQPPAPVQKLGAPGGPEIDNKNTILGEIDELLGMTKPPAIEFIFVEPYASWNLFFIPNVGLSRNPYGHAAIRYTLPDGTQKVMNIVGFKTETNEMVNFIPPEEYFFGTGKFAEGCEQMGVYNRNFVSIRIEDYPAEKIRDLDYYFEKLQRRSHEKRAEYSMVMGPVWNFLREWLPWPLNIAERGNCAMWTSKGLVEADLLRWPNAWPKSIWVDLYETWGGRDRKNVHVVSYRRINQAQLSYGKPLYSPSVVEPLNTLSNLSYINLEKFADVIVEVPGDSTKAVVRRQEPQFQPSFYRHYKFSITATTCFALYFILRRR